MKILISGAGLAGMTLAYWLSQEHYEVTIIEVASTLREDGYGIDFFGSGYDVAERMGILESLSEQQINADHISFIDSDGSDLARLDLESMRDVMNGRYIPLMHWTLEKALYNALPESVNIRFGCALQSVTQTEKNIAVVFDDGKSETFDLLIGADGVHSRTRELVFGPESEYAHYLGYQVACYRLDDDFGIGRSWKNYTEPDRQSGAYCTDHENEVISQFIWKTPNPDHVPHDQRLPVLRQAFKGMGWQTEQLLAAAPTEGIFMDSLTQIRMPRWHEGRVALVGDACGCMTLISGQGASMAMGSAYVLAESLGKYSEHELAFQTYENQLRPEIEARQDKAESFARAFVPGSELGLDVQQLMMKLLFHDAFKGLLKHQFMADSVLQRALKRSVASGKNSLGYTLDGRLHETDIQSLSLEIDSLLKDNEFINLLLEIRSLDGVDLDVLWEDIRFGREYGKHIHKLAIVGDKLWSEWLAVTARPWYAKESRHFHSDEIDQAWNWLQS
jgi:2-polyprenyl-6-methoxyphenol hydroxylase-like FAD-dependent oxidoreductase